MKSLTLHLKILILTLFCLGAGSILYQVFVLKIPVTEQATGALWTVDTQINFSVQGTKPVKIDLMVPSKVNSSPAIRFDQDNIVTNQYGIVREEDDLGNQVLSLSSRRVSGKQTLYYRLLVSQEESANRSFSGPKGAIYTDAIPLSGPEQTAADGLIATIRSQSSDTSSFITEAIQILNDPNNDLVKVLLGSNRTPENKFEKLKILLSQAHIPIQAVHTLKLAVGSNQEPELWVRSYIETEQKGSDKDKKQKRGAWQYFSLKTGQKGLPADRLIWWVGDEKLLTVTNAQNVKVNFSLDNRELTSIGLIANKLESTPSSSFLAFSLYSLPIQIQETYLTMIVIPFGVLVILLFRNIVGVQTLGTFTPVLIALAFRETGLIFGLFLFTFIVAIGLSIRSYLEHLKLQMLPRLSVVLTCVVILIAIISLFSHKLGLDQGLAVTLFPMVILTMTIERLSVTWEERGGGFAFKVAIGTFFTASVAFYVMSLSDLSYFAFTFPGILLVLMSFMLAMGRYRGYRLTELKRFKALIKEG